MTIAPVAAPPSPYKGLAPFEDSDVDALLFFGRERESEIVAANLVASRLTILYGPSGVGKSSLLRAAVAYGLRKQGERNRAATGMPEIAPVVFSSWAHDPVQGLQDAVAAAVVELYAGSIDPLAPEGSLADVFDAWSHVVGGDLYVILDQFEEYFLYHGSAVDPETFAEAFADAVTRPGLRANFLVGLREDALANLDAFKARVPNVFGNFLRLDRLDRRAGKAAIVRPLEEYSRLSASRAPVTAEPGLVDAVLSEVAAGSVDFGIAGRGVAKAARGGARIEAPYLQLVMQRLWDAEALRGSSVLRRSTLEELGGARHMVEEHLEHALGALTPDQRDEAASMFNQLVTPSGTKIAHGLGDLANYAGRPEDELREVVAALRDARVLRPVADGEDGEGSRYEIFHDVLAEAVLGWRARHEAERALERQRREAHRRNRRALVIAGIALAALAVMTAIAIYAVAQRGEARRQASAAHARQLEADRLANQAQKAERRTLRALHVAEQETQRANGLARKFRHQKDVATAAVRREQEKSAELSDEKQKLIRTTGALRKTSAGLRQTSEGLRKTTINLSAAKADALRQRDRARASAKRERRAADALAVETRVAVGAKNKADRATVRARSAQRRALAGEKIAAARALLTTDTARSLATALAAVDDLRAAHLQPGLNVEDLLRDGLLALRLRTVMRGVGPVTSALFSPDGRQVLVAGRRGLMIVDLRGKEIHARLLRPSMQLGAADWSPDGRLVAAGGTGGGRLLRVWDVDSGAVVRTMAHDGAIRSIAFSRDGRFLASGSADGNARVWDVGSWVNVATIPQPRGANVGVRMVSFSPDGTRLLTAAGDRFARVVDVSTGALAFAPLNQGTPVTSARYSHDGRLIATAGGGAAAGDSVRVWDAATGERRFGLRHSTGVFDVAFSPDDTLLATTGGADTIGRVWNLAERALQATFTRHLSGIKSVSFNPDGTSVVSAGRDGAAYIWGVDGGFVRTAFLGHGRALTGASFSPDGTTVVTESDDGSARLWDANVDPSSGTPGATSTEIGNHADPITAVAFSRDGRRLLSAGEDGTARLWGRGKPMILQHDKAVTAAEFSRDSKFVITGGDDGTARVWRVADGSPIATLEHGAPVRVARLSPNGRLALTAGVDGTVALWDGRRGALLRRLTHAATVNEARFSSDGTLLVTASEDKTAAIWRVRDGKRLWILAGHGGGVVAAAFSPGDRYVATASRDGTAIVWDVASGKPRYPPLEGHRDELRALAFSPDGRRLVTASVDQDARVWNVRTGVLVDVLRIHAGPVSDLAFSFDGRWLATAGPGAAGIWEVTPSGSWPLRYLVRGAKRPINAIAFSPRGWTILTGSREGSVRTYRCPVCGHVADLTRIARSRLGEIARPKP